MRKNPSCTICSIVQLLIAHCALCFFIKFYYSPKKHMHVTYIYNTINAIVISVFAPLSLSLLIYNISHVFGHVACECHQSTYTSSIYHCDSYDSWYHRSVHSLIPYIEYHFVGGPFTSTTSRVNIIICAHGRQSSWSLSMSINKALLCFCAHFLRICLSSASTAHILRFEKVIGFHIVWHIKSIECKSSIHHPPTALTPQTPDGIEWKNK